MEELRLAIKQYLESREKLQDCLSNVEINKAANSADSAALLSIINDSFLKRRLLNCCYMQMLMRLKGISTCFTYKETLN